MLMIFSRVSKTTMLSTRNLRYPSMVGSHLETDRSSGCLGCFSPSLACSLVCIFIDTDFSSSTNIFLGGASDTQTNSIDILNNHKT
ncbi:uncharacterized protein DS421_17g591960 [Arachis hypogaea]|nr:uncharacterized protein DS421_17g591960 [Arachis hypogaea]